MEFNNIIISFTTFPKRFHLARELIKHVLNFKFKCDKFICWLSTDECNDDQLHYFDDLINDYFTVEYIKENIKPYKKLIPAIKKYSKYIITIDDDSFIEEHKIKKLIEMSKKYPDAVCANSVKPIIIDNSSKIIPYLHFDKYISKLKENCELHGCISIGVNGVIYPPSYSKNLEFLCNDDIFMKEFSCNDDIWFYIYETLYDIPIVWLGMKYYKYPINIRGVESTPCLHKTNVNVGGNNDRYFHKMFEIFPELKEKKYYYLNFTTQLQ